MSPVIKNNFPGGAPFAPLHTYVKYIHIVHMDGFPCIEMQNINGGSWTSCQLLDTSRISLSPTKSCITTAWAIFKPNIGFVSMKFHCYVLQMVMTLNLAYKNDKAIVRQWNKLEIKL